MKPVSSSHRENYLEIGDCICSHESFSVNILKYTESFRPSSDVLSTASTTLGSQSQTLLASGSPVFLYESGEGDKNYYFSSIPALNMGNLNFTMPGWKVYRGHMSLASNVLDFAANDPSSQHTDSLAKNWQDTNGNPTVWAAKFGKRLSNAIRQANAVTT
ncbi:hypothetical protein SUNI508_12208 [Seiridium unicorne]|uniref:Uncharacterized protein n=1 Tax=Seiridium unicorne TaxID=138068 RepID=A0ABR2UEH8_9PEZI